MAESDNDDDTLSQFLNQEDVKTAEPCAKRARLNTHAVPTDFHCVTQNAKRFCTMFTAIAATGASSVQFHFTTMGMILYASANNCGSVSKAFWNKEFFQEYTCPTEFKMWVCMKQLAQLVKNIKNIQLVTFNSENAGSFEVLKCTGLLRSEKGVTSSFFFNLFNMEAQDQPVDFSKLQWVLNITTPANAFKETLGFLKPSSDTSLIQIKFANNKLDFFSVGESGVTESGVNQSADICEPINDHTFELLFHMKHLQAVTVASDLSTMLNINCTLEQSVIYFAYTLDSLNPPSRFGIYIAPAVQASN